MHPFKLILSFLTLLMFFLPSFHTTTALPSSISTSHKTKLSSSGINEVNGVNSTTSPSPSGPLELTAGPPPKPPPPKEEECTVDRDCTLFRECCLAVLSFALVAFSFALWRGGGVFQRIDRLTCLSCSAWYVCCVSRLPSYLFSSPFTWREWG